MDKAHGFYKNYKKRWYLHMVRKKAGDKGSDARRTEDVKETY